MPTAVIEAMLSRKEEAEVLDPGADAVSRFLGESSEDVLRSCNDVEKSRKSLGAR